LDGKVNVIRHTAGSGTFAARVAGHGGQIRVEPGADVLAKTWEAILCAENEVQEDVVE
jgi:hypothetical protein